MLNKFCVFIINTFSQHYDLAENPLKDMFKNILWKMEMTQVAGEYACILYSHLSP